VSEYKKLKSNLLRGEIKHQEVIISMIRGILIDDTVSEKEISGLVDFLESNPQLTESYPGDIVLKNCRLYLTNSLGMSISSFFREIIGDQIDISTRFPIDNINQVNFQSSLFCFTGKFEYGTRAKCHSITESLGGRFSDDVVLNLNYLVIGKYSNPDWVSTTHGRKIEKAMHYKKHNKTDLLILSEEIWISEVGRLKKDVA